MHQREWGKQKKKFQLSREISESKNRKRVRRGSSYEKIRGGGFCRREGEYIRSWEWGIWVNDEWERHHERIIKQWLNRKYFSSLKEFFEWSFHKKAFLMNGKRLVFFQFFCYEDPYMNFSYMDLALVTGSATQYIDLYLNIQWMKWVKSGVIIPFVDLLEGTKGWV